MTISWFGQSCFRLEGKEASLLIDPFSKEIGLRSPKIKDQIVLVTHEHYDHNNLEAATETICDGATSMYSISATETSCGSPWRRPLT